jgi:hypothetical protein
MSAMNAKTKQIIKIVLLLAASGFFLYQGFSLLFSEQPDTAKTVKSTISNSVE